MRKKKILIYLQFLLLVFASYSIEMPSELKLLIKAYPDIKFSTSYNTKYQDWRIEITTNLNNKTISTPLYWADGRLIPESELANKEKYLSIFYPYPKGQELQDPATYTEEQMEKYRQAGLSTNRKTEPYAADFFFDILYDTKTRTDMEDHLVKAKFLGHKVNIHQSIVEPLSRVENRILEEAKTNTNIANFLVIIDHLEGYNWREIRDVHRKSLHSMGIAFDVLPAKLNKHIYWRWTKDQKGDKWMLTPLNKRWMPTYDFINIFEDEGFVWGGKWEIWDNMHFEYRPELILYAENLNSK